MRDIIKRYTSEYRNGNKSQKTKILKLIQDAIAGNGTRFLLPYNTQQPLEGCKLATQTEIRGKISHGLRDAIKVEDLLDSEFVQLWSTQAATCTPPHVPPIPPHVVSPSPNFGMANMPFHPVNDGVVNSAIPSPMSFQSSSNITQPPPFSLGQQRPLMNLDQQQAMMLLQQQGLAMNAMQALPYGNQSMNSYLTQPDLRSNLGPAIFHITTNLPTDKTEDGKFCFSSLITSVIQSCCSHLRVSCYQTTLLWKQQRKDCHRIETKYHRQLLWRWMLCLLPPLALVVQNKISRFGRLVLLLS